eukprot:TRINITY_DN12395_c2_g1_i5.p1 TRINITY_DN12395_c2_g1~~TRINITY_DN12395_c2_g1_i5.p1  ORF type:complete len:286 (+),score=74.73 TRINITY_DN12395_c2_g1_i5:32-889(+)
MPSRIRQRVPHRQVWLHLAPGLVFHILTQAHNATCSASPTMLLSSTPVASLQRNFTSASRIDQNRTAAQLAAKLNSLLPAKEPSLMFSGRSIRNIIVWGNHSETMVPDLAHARVAQADGAYGMPEASTLVKAALPDEDFLTSELVETVRKRGKAIVAKRRMTPAMSGSIAVCDHLNTLHNGTKEGEFVNMGVYTDGNPYNMPPGLFFSFPCTVAPGGEWQVKAGLELDERTKHLLDASARELMMERQAAFTLCGLEIPKENVTEPAATTAPDETNGMDPTPDDVQ